MKRFLITSPKFEGSAELLYNEMGTLSKIDLAQTNMDEMKVQHFKDMVPATVYKLQEAFVGTKVTIVSAEYEINFDLFYKDYPHKRNAFRVRKEFDKLSKTDQIKAFASLHSYKKYLNRNSWQTPMIGDRYLRDREFETEWNKL